MKNLFKYRAWIRTITTWLCVPAFFYGAYLIWNDLASAWWLLGTFIVYQMSMLILSVGNHRLFSHRMFKCHRFWHWFFAIWGVAFGNGSAMTWVYIHLGHHRFADTPQDPHETTFKYFFRWTHKPFQYDIPAVKWMMRDPVHRYTHQFAVIWVLLVALVAYLISWEFFIFCYLIPMGYHQITGGLFYIFSHTKDGAANRYWLEFILPFAGEWNHKIHHAPGGSKVLDNKQKWYQFDLGYLFARLIKNG